ncbi:MAG: HAMP domain-containing protein [Epulopiscium sp.]|nr:HAMP domain-containing protein [Candidatus Epulonipiscium sp.]
MKEMKNQNLKGKKSILTKMFLGITIPAVLILALASTLILHQVKIAVTNGISNELEVRSEYAALEVTKFFDRYLELTKQLAANHQLRDLLQEVDTPDMRITTAEKYESARKVLENGFKTEEENGILAIFVGDFSSSQFFLQDGYHSDLSFDITTRPWYQVNNTKKPLLVPPYEDIVTKKMTLTMAVPVFDAKGSNVLGAVGTDLPLDSVMNKFKSYTLGQTGFFLLVSNDGNIVYHPDSNYINKNISEINISSSAAEAIAKRQNGAVVYEIDGQQVHGYLSDVGDSGWSVLTGLPDKEFYHSYNLIRTTIYMIFGGVLILMAMLMVLVSRSIVNPLKKLADTANEIADGRLDVTVMTDAQDETGVVAMAIGRSVERLRQYVLYIEEITSVLDEIAHGNLRFELKNEYIGEFAKIKNALLNISVTLSDTLTQIDVASDQVANGSEQIASGAQALSQGATEQAGSIEQLAAVIGELTNHITNTASNAADGNKKAEMLAMEINESNQKMKKMMEAMNDISNASNEIGKIIKTIEDIAFQTNILALNAAVEAARAGSAGKGFAVVADEVRNLAGKSAEAARTTTALIEKSLRAVSDGTLIADQTAQSLTNVVTNAHDVTSAINQITSATEEQTHSIQEINIGIEQVSSVIQSNSATAEESAAASEELSGQAQMLKDLMSKFKLRS